MIIVSKVIKIKIAEIPEARSNPCRHRVVLVIAVHVVYWEIIVSKVIKKRIEILSKDFKLAREKKANWRNTT
jgi:hypothetical protein